MIEIGKFVFVLVLVLVVVVVSVAAAAGVLVEGLLMSKYDLTPPQILQVSLKSGCQLVPPSFSCIII